MKRPNLLSTMLGFICGVCATGPMSAVMIALHRRLPEEEKYPLPPSEITQKITNNIFPTESVSSNSHRLLSWLAHFGYGGAAGVVYANIPLPIPSGMRGPLFGLIVWLTSYFGLLPVLGILSPANRHPLRRNILMIVAHLVWGWMVAILLDSFLSERKQFSPAFPNSPRKNADCQ